MTNAQKLADSWKELELTDIQRGIILMMGFKRQTIGGTFFAKAYNEAEMTGLIQKGLVKYDKEKDEYWMTDEVAEAVQIRFENAEPLQTMFHSKL